ncbi:MAG TPA: ribosome-associated translation inhibitor RaiA [Thermoanaerobaculia bacterium]|nr:ribosome-associated translation inhibitor RaiA [Thermoanaerobaculia bacterium]
MKIEIVGRNVPVEDRLRQRAEKKLGKLDKFLAEPVEARLTLSLEKHLHVAEIYVSHRDGSLRAREQAEGNLFEALDLVLDNAAYQARRAAERQKDGKRGRGADHRWPLDILESDSVGGGRVPQVIESTHLQIKPMTVEEAALALESEENGFVVFREAGSQRVSVLYRRKDKNYGLIAPE